MWSKKNYAQHSEFGFLGGLAFYTGELNPSPSPQNNINPILGVFYRKNTSKRYALRFGFNYAKLSADDQNDINFEVQNFETRNLSFSSSLYDVYGILEFNFIPYSINNSQSKFTPFVFIGIGGYYISPKVVNNITQETNKTSTSSISVPFGTGVKFNVINNIGSSIEWTYRKTFTDKIDGIEELHQNGLQQSNTANKDWYSFITFSISYRFSRKSDKCAYPIN